jgi:integrase
MIDLCIFAASDESDVYEESSSLSSGTSKNSIVASQEAILLSNGLHGVKNGVSFKEYRKLCMAKKSLPYKLPKIIRNKNGDWYVQYYYRDPKHSKWVPFKERKGINYIKDLNEKEAAASELSQQLTNWLKAGNGPFVGEQVLEQQLAPIQQQVEKVKAGRAKWNLERAIKEYRIFISQQGYADTTLKAYNKYLRAFEAWLVENNGLESVASAFSESEVEVFLNDYYQSEDWSERTFNNYLEFMITFFGRVKKLEKKKSRNRDLRYDFDPDELETKITKPQRNKAFTGLMIDKLKKLLTVDRQNLRDYLEWLFLSLMRPSEVRNLKVVDIDDLNRQIRIVGKSGDRLIPISDQLMKIIHRRGILGKTLNSYVFGYAGNVDERRMSVNYFLMQFSEIRRKLNLSDNYGPYSMKPTGVLMMIYAGFKDEEIMVLTGHKTKDAFEAYKRDLVIENNHVMKGSTIEF